MLERAGRSFLPLWGVRATRHEFCVHQSILRRVSRIVRSRGRRRSKSVSRSPASVVENRSPVGQSARRPPCLPFSLVFLFLRGGFMGAIIQVRHLFLAVRYFVNRWAPASGQRRVFEREAERTPWLMRNCKIPARPKSEAESAAAGLNCLRPRKRKYAGKSSRFEFVRNRGLLASAGCAQRVEIAGQASLYCVGV